RAAWTQILAVGCRLPCDPPVGVHAHATEGTISHPAVLRCGISTPLRSAVGQNEKPPFLGLCRLRPVADIGARRVSPDKDARPGSPRSGRGGNATHSRQVASFVRVAGGEGGGVFMASLTAPRNTSAAGGARSSRTIACAATAEQWSRPVASAQTPAWTRSD